MFFGTGRVPSTGNLKAVVFDDFGERQEQEEAGFFGARIHANNLRACQAGAATASAKTSKPLTPQIINLTTDPTPNTESSFAVSDVNRFLISNRGNVAVKLAFVAGGSSMTHLTITPGNVYEEGDFDPGISVTFYIQASVPSVPLEVVIWS